MTDDVIRGYAAASDELIPRFEAIAPAQLYAPVIDLLPAPPARIADIGAGTGRDAAWLARQGHAVTAVEPATGLRLAGMERHGSSGIEWLDDRLPKLSSLQRHRPFDVVLLSAVWQHLDDGERGVAMRRLAGCTAAGGMLIMSLRHGPGAPGRPVHPARPEDTIAAALEAGFRLVRQCSAESMQAANRAAEVHWTWLAFGAP